MTRITVIGLGEAGSLFAAGLAEAGALVQGYDPYLRYESVACRPLSFVQVDDIDDAVRSADLVISLVGAAAAGAVAESILPRLRTPTVFADFNTSSPTDKVARAAMAARYDVAFADVAVLAPVPRAGSRTPLLASGIGAAKLGELLQPLGVPIEVIDGEAGMAASRKLLRSVFMKGLAGVVLETLAAGEASGNEEWVRGQMAAELGPDGESLIERLVSGSRAHAERRMHEVQDTADYLSELMSPRWITEASLQWLDHLRKDIS